MPLQLLHVALWDSRYGSSRPPGYFSPTVFRILNNMGVDMFKYSDCLQVAVILRKRDLWEQLLNQYWLGGMEMGLLGLKFECLFLANSGRSHLLSTSLISNTEQTFFPAAWVLQLIVVSVCVRENKERIELSGHTFTGWSLAERRLIFIAMQVAQVPCATE